MLPLSSHFTPTDSKHQHLGELTDAKIKYLEDSTVFTLREKIELLGLLTHTKWVTEVDTRRDQVDPSQAYIDVLANLGLPWRNEHYVKRDGKNVYWMQVGANEAVLEYLAQKSRDRLSVLEAGISVVNQVLGGGCL